MCLSRVMIKDSALGQQVFFLPLDAELLTHVNPNALENQGRTEDPFFFFPVIQKPHNSKSSLCYSSKVLYQLNLLLEQLVQLLYT